MTTTRAPTVRDADLETMRVLLEPLVKAFLGWEDLWRYYGGILPPSISKEDVRRFVIPRLAK